MRHRRNPDPRIQELARRERTPEEQAQLARMLIRADDSEAFEELIARPLLSSEREHYFFDVSGWAWSPVEERKRGRVVAQAQARLQNARSLACAEALADRHGLILRNRQHDDNTVTLELIDDLSLEYDGGWTSVLKSYERIPVGERAAQPEFHRLTRAELARAWYSPVELREAYEQGLCSDYHAKVQFNPAGDRRLQDLRRRAAAGDAEAAAELEASLARAGEATRLDQLEAAARAGDVEAYRTLVDYWAERCHDRKVYDLMDIAVNFRSQTERAIGQSEAHEAWSEALTWTSNRYWHARWCEDPHVETNPRGDRRLQELRRRAAQDPEAARRYEDELYRSGVSTQRFMLPIVPTYHPWHEAFAEDTVWADMENIGGAIGELPTPLLFSLTADRLIEHAKDPASYQNLLDEDWEQFAEGEPPGRLHEIVAAGQPTADQFIRAMRDLAPDEQRRRDVNTVIGIAQQDPAVLSSGIQQGILPVGRMSTNPPGSGDERLLELERRLLAGDVSVALPLLTVYERTGVFRRLEPGEIRQGYRLVEAFPSSVGRVRIEQEGQMLTVEDVRGDELVFELTPAGDLVLDPASVKSRDRLTRAALEYVTQQRPAVQQAIYDATAQNVDFELHRVEALQRTLQERIEGLARSLTWLAQLRRAMG